MKCRGFLLWVGIGVLLFAGLQNWCAYHFYFVEQNRLFLCSWDYVWEHLLRPGGLAEVVAGFMVQFFIFPYIGAGVTAALLAVAGWLAHVSVRRIAPGANVAIACLVASVALLFVHFDFNYMEGGTVAFVFAECAFCLVLRIGRAAVRHTAHLLVVPLLFGIAGPVALLYAATAWIYEMTGGSKRSWIMLAAVVEALLLGALSSGGGMYADCRHALLPDGYYHPNLAPRGIIYLAWIVFPALIALACLMRRRKTAVRRRWTGIAAQAAIVAALCLWGIPKYADRKSYMMKELDYYCRTEEWNKIVERCRGTLTNYLYICYANLALAQRGELGDRMFTFDQRGVKGLLVDWNKTASVSVLLSDVYFAMNEVSPSQQMAFEAYVSSPSPRMLKRLVQTNLICGAYPVAAKYIDILEQAPAYFAWATSHRKFLYNDAAVESDPLLGDKRRSLTSSRALALTEGIDVELQRIAEANPSSIAPIHYAGAFCLLAKDTERFRALVERHFNTSVLSSLPTAFQEAVIILSENEPAYWQKFGVSAAVVRRFAGYRQQLAAHSRRAVDNRSLASLMSRDFGDTYWFYFMFK
jgi:hypothetical protein